MPSTINAQPGNATTATALIKTGAADANLVLQTGGANAVTIDGTQTANFVTTGAIIVPKGTQAQRPSPASNGMLRYCTDLATPTMEIYINGSWVTLT
jgi:hypothetical protein